ncbi:O-antigen ligase family protein [Halobacillus hunanensis]|uniref:O-antigen ligase family protein n=1 Tax=Halobacillus hunanensis TaxID=578214 RepID=UPI0009A731E4|nr:hypothetical protein [Halobacillus hunanensis]
MIIINIINLNYENIHGAIYLNSNLTVKKSNLLYITWLAVLAMYSSNFFGYGEFIPIILFPYILLYLLVGELSKKSMLTLVCLFVFSFTYSLISFFYGYFTLASLLGRLLYPSILFVLGYKLAGSDFSNKKSLGYLITIIIASSLYGFFSLMKSILTYGSINAIINNLGGRIVLDLWGSGEVNATILNASLSLGLSLLPLLLNNSSMGSSLKYQFKFKLLCLLSFVVSFYTIFSLGNRTGIVIVIFSFLTVYLFVEKNNRKRFSKAISLFFITIIGYLLYSLNIFSIKSIWEGSLIFNRLSSRQLSENPRIDAWINVFIGTFEHPLGGRETNIHLGFAHNLWLDVAYDAGIIPFILLILFTFISLFSIYKFLKSDFTLIFKSLILAMCIAFFITFSLEPILQGLITYFTSFCFVIGILQRKVHDKKQLNSQLTSGDLATLKD